MHLRLHLTSLNTGFMVSCIEGILLMMDNKQHALCQVDRHNPEACLTKSGINNTASWLLRTHKTWASACIPQDTS